MVVLTTGMQEALDANGITLEFDRMSEETLAKPEFRHKWTKYILSIQYDCTPGEIPMDTVEEYAELIFG